MKRLRLFETAMPSVLQSKLIKLDNDLEVRVEINKNSLKAMISDSKGPIVTLDAKSFAALQREVKVRLKLLGASFDSETRALRKPENA